jgi:Ca2+/H+ antiporter
VLKAKSVLVAPVIAVMSFATSKELFYALNHGHLVSLALNDFVRANLHEVLCHPSLF